MKLVDFLVHESGSPFVYLDIRTATWGEGTGAEGPHTTHWTRKPIMQRIRSAPPRSASEDSVRNGSQQVRTTGRRNSGRKECDAKLMDDAWARIRPGSGASSSSSIPIRRCGQFSRRSCGAPI